MLGPPTGQSTRIIQCLWTNLKTKTAFAKATTGRTCEHHTVKARQDSHLSVKYWCLHRITTCVCVSRIHIPVRQGAEYGQPKKKIHHLPKHTTFILTNAQGFKASVRITSAAVTDRRMFRERATENQNTQTSQSVHIYFSSLLLL